MYFSFIFFDLDRSWMDGTGDQMEGQGEFQETTGFSGTTCHAASLGALSLLLS
jgi:hypothetical protein